MVKSGAAQIIQERDLTPEHLGEVIGRLAADRGLTLRMALASRAARGVDAAERLADLCLTAGAHA
jgi:UDP-N-acetylglucosamine:LPS N-acetylglucosamine transferase